MFVEIIALVIVLAIVLGMGYLISISDLPDWFKFFC